MTVLVAAFGCILIFIVLWDAFETIVLPRRVTRRIRLTRLFYYYTWKPWAALARRMHSSKRRDSYLGFYGPLSLLVLISIWAISLVVGFAMLQWALGAKLNVTEEASGFGTYLYMSGTTFFTLGLGVNRKWKKKSRLSISDSRFTIKWICNRLKLHLWCST